MALCGAMRSHPSSCCLWRVLPLVSARGLPAIPGQLRWAANDARQRGGLVLSDRAFVAFSWAKRQGTPVDIAVANRRGIQACLWITLGTIGRGLNQMWRDRTAEVLEPARSGYLLCMPSCRTASLARCGRVWSAPATARVRQESTGDGRLPSLSGPRSGVCAPRRMQRATL